MPRAKRVAEVIHIGGEVPTDGGNEAISYQEPYRVEIAVEGSADILFHRWNAEAVDEKAAAAKGSKAKKTGIMAQIPVQKSHSIAARLPHKGVIGKEGAP